MLLKILDKIEFPPEKNRMRKIGDINNSIKQFNEKKNKNLYFLLKNRFGWMNDFINEKDIGLEVGAGSGFSKNFIKNKNFKICDLANYDHLDYKNVDAQDTKFPNNTYDFVIASNMIHHVPFPIKFLREMHRILKPNGKLIIQEAYCSIIFQLITILMRHEGFDFTKDIWSEKESMSDKNNIWSGNIAVPHLIFDDIKKFEKEMGDKFKLHHQKIYECLSFLNSGGVSSKTFYLPMNYFFLKIVKLVDASLVSVLPSFFGMGRQIVLLKN